jgi:hypothetical protein
MTRLSPIVRTGVLCAAVLATCGIASGQISQTNADYVGMEAEYGVTIVENPNSTENYDWTITTMADAMGGDTNNALIAAPFIPPNKYPAPTFAKWAIDFSQAGTYHLYYRWKAHEDATAEDTWTANSFFRATEFATSDPDAAMMNTLLNSAPGDSEDAGYRSDGTSNLAQAPASNTWSVVQDSQTYTIDAAGTHYFVVGMRESGLALDRILFSQTSGMTEQQFADADVVPEPATLGLLSFGALALLRRRRKTA